MTTLIPIVFALAMDPVGLGHVQSLSRPGGNFTGFTFIDPEMIGKWMALLKDMLAGLTQAAILYNPQTVHVYASFLKEIHAAERPGGIELKAMPCSTTEQMQSAIATLAKTPGSGLMIGRTRSTRCGSS